MINSFSRYLVEEEKVVYFAFGRMNPPTIGHGKLMDALAKKAGRNPYFIYLSQSQSPKKDPLEFKSKIKHVRKMFPKHARQVVINNKVTTPFHALSDLYSKGYRKVVMIAGSDRINEYDLRLNKYNGKKGSHGFYNFDGGVKIINAGARDPDAEGAEGASGTKQRGYATDANFTKFAQGLPKTMSNNDARRLFNDVRKGMGLKEENEFKRHVQLQPVSETREKFIEGKLFNIGEQVIIKKTDEVGTITVLGSNYVIVETADRKTRQWLDAVEKIQEEYKYTEGTPEAAAHARKITPGQAKEGNGLWANMHAKKARGEKMRKKGAKGAPTPDQIKRAQEATTPQDTEIADRKGTQPARYHKGLAKATKAVRDRQFKKQAKMSDSNPAAYKDAPGDKEARNKDMPVSKHTKFVRNMMKEDDNQSHVDVAKKRVDREKEIDKKKHDRIMDRARTRDVKKVNMQTEGSFADKSKASGISTGTLKKVYNRGVAAWKTGHRPGTTPQQWGHARVNAFIRKKKQGGLNHDKDLA